MSLVTMPGRRATSSWWACAALLLAWVAVLGMVLTGEGLAEEDGPTLRWLVQHRSGSMDRLFEAISSTPLDGAAAGLGAALVLVVAVRTRSLRPLLVLGASGAGAVALAELVKALVRRARPAADVMLGPPETGSGFPSAHTLVFTALAGAVALVVWRTTASALVRAAAVGVATAAALAMGVSRLYLGDHWPTDVLASYALAGAVLAAVAALSSPDRRATGPRAAAGHLWRGAPPEQEEGERDARPGGRRRLPRRPRVRGGQARLLRPGGA